MFSDHPVHPAEGVLGASVLDVPQPAADALGEGPRGPAVTDLPATPLERPHRGDHGGGAAGEHLADPARCHTLTPLVDGDAALLDRVAELAAELDDGVAGDPLEDGSRGLRGHDAAVVAYEVEVHAAELLDVPALGGVEERDLVAALLDRLLLRDQRAGVVAPGLRGTHPAAPGAGVGLAEPDRHRVDAGCEVRPGGRADHHVGDVL